MSGFGEIAERYLDALQVRLRGTPRDIRHALRESEEHLADAIADAIDEGLPGDEAERRAVARFGPVEQVARGFNHSAASLRDVARSLVAQALALGGFALVAIGVSGVVARLMIALGSSSFVFGDAPGRSYPAGDCAYWLSIHPKAGSCSQAALAENVADGLLYRYAAGIAGLVLLGLLAWWARRTGSSLRLLLGAPVAAIAGTTAFAAAAAITTGLGVNAVRFDGGNGAGQWFSAAGVAAVAAVLLATVSLRWLRELPGTREIGSAR